MKKISKIAFDRSQLSGLTQKELKDLICWINGRQLLLVKEKNVFTYHKIESDGVFQTECICITNGRLIGFKNYINASDRADDLCNFITNQYKLNN